MYSNNFDAEFNYLPFFMDGNLIRKKVENYGKYVKNTTLAV